MKVLTVKTCQDGDQDLTENWSRPIKKVKSLSTRFFQCLYFLEHFSTIVLFKVTMSISFIKLIDFKFAISPTCITVAGLQVCSLVLSLSLFLSLSYTHHHRSLSLSFSYTHPLPLSIAVVFLFFFCLSFWFDHATGFIDIVKGKTFHQRKDHSAANQLLYHQRLF